MSAPSALKTPWLPKLVVAPSFVLALFFIYGLIAWNGYLSLSASRLLPNYEFVGIEQYVNLFESERFRVALEWRVDKWGPLLEGSMQELVERR